MEDWIPLNRPYFTSDEHAYVQNVLDSGMVSQGEWVKTLEKRVRAFVGARYAVAVSSATAGLYLVRKFYGDYTMVTPGYGFPAVSKIGITIPTTVNEKTYNITKKDLLDKRGAIKESGCMKILVPVHQFGLPVDMDELLEADCGGWRAIIEDAACALGSVYKGERIGHRGTAVFSFHGRKIVTTGEGGMVVTDRRDLADFVRKGREFGGIGAFDQFGMNFKMSNLSAAVGCAQMDKIYDIMHYRDQIARCYNKELTRDRMIDGYKWSNYWLPPYYGVDDNGCQTNWQSYVIRVFTQKAEIPSQQEIIARMRKSGVEVQVGSYACDVINDSNTYLAETTLALPIWPGMTYEHVSKVVRSLEKAVGKV